MKLPKSSGIYAIRHSDGRTYIGSAVNLAKRISHHKTMLRSGRHANRHLQRAWRKHGEESFSFEVLELVAADDLLKAEQRHIDDSGAAVSGFNMCPKAGNSAGRKFAPQTLRKMSELKKGRAISDETKQKMRAAHKGRPHSPEHRANLAAANARRRGKPMSEESKRKMSESAKARVARSPRLEDGRFGKWSEKSEEVYQEFTSDDKRKTRRAA